MRTIASVLILSAIALAMPPRPGALEGTNSPLPVYPPGVEVAGPNRLKGYSDLETVTILMQFPDNRADTLKRSPAPAAGSHFMRSSAAPSPVPHGDGRRSPSPR